MIKEVKFKDAFEFQKKSKIKAGDGLKLDEGKYSFYTSSNRLTKSINEYLFKKESLIFGTGGLASIHYCDEKFAVSTDCFVTQPKNSDELFLKYIYYFLSGNIHILENGFKGAGLKHISKGYISDIKIPLPPLDQQKKIAAILDAADAYRQKTKALIEKYDELTQSLFLDMFGVNERNLNNWKEVTIQDISADHKGSMRTGPFGSDLLHSEFVSDGIPVLGIDNAVLNKFQWKERRFITLEKYQKLKRYTIFPKDIVVTIMGTVGRVAVIPDNIGTAINTKHLAAITLNREVANPDFIAFSILNDQYIKHQIKSQGKGAIMDGLNLTIIKGLKLFLPQIELQNQFSKKVQAIEAQKAQAEAGLVQADNLFNSLLQRAFKGELV
jgi:type I restriction enzyme S subunit